MSDRPFVVRNTRFSEVIERQDMDDFIGDAFVAEGTAYRAEAVALSDVVTCPISRDQFLQMSLKAPGFVLGLREILSGHLFDCRAQLASGYDPVMVRVAKVLLDLAEHFGEPEADGWVTVASNLKHEEIASMVSATRVSVTMAIGELREQGLVEGSRGTYRLHAPALASMAQTSGVG